MCLNPCCNGIYSMSSRATIKTAIKGSVLILVVMEYTQWERSGKARENKVRLNPCCNGIYSMRSDESSQEEESSLNPCCNGIYSMSGNKNWKV